MIYAPPPAVCPAYNIVKRAEGSGSVLRGAVACVVVAVTLEVWVSWHALWVSKRGEGHADENFTTVPR